MRAPSPPRSPVAAALLAVLTGLLLAAGGALAYVRTEIGSDRAFSGRLVSALDDPAVRGLVADRSVDALLDRGPGDLLAVRPLLSTVVEAVVAGAPFRRLATIGVADAHRGLVARRGSVALTVERTGQLLLTAVRSVSPAVAARTPAEVRPLLTRVNPDNPVLRASATPSTSRDGAGRSSPARWWRRWPRWSSPRTAAGPSGTSGPRWPARARWSPASSRSVRPSPSATSRA